MKSKTIYKVASLVMTLVMIVGNTIHTQAALSTAAVTSPSIYWGALVNGNAPTTTNLQGVFNTFETRSGKKMSIIHWGQSWIMKDGSWGEFQTSYFDNVRNHGSIPMLNWDSQRLGAGLNQADFQLRDVYGGTYDTYIRRWATDARNWGHPFFLYFDPEMNGWWEPWGEGKLSSGAIINGNSPGDYVKAWRHVHDIFTSVGATNVSWVWAPNHMSTSSQYPVLSTLYPGDAYVDWTGLSVYNKYNTWAGLNPLLTGSQGMTWFRNSYNDVLTLAPNKPMMLAQWASIEAGDGGAKKAAWITDALTVQIPLNFPKIKAIVWFNWQEVPSETYPIETSQAATNAWAAGIASPVYVANQFINLNISPIPPVAELTHTISGNAGVGGVVMTYSVNGVLNGVMSDENGNYLIAVPYQWSGTVTPLRACYTFTPSNRSYSNVLSNQSGQSYSAAFNGSSCGASPGMYDDGDAHWTYTGTWNSYSGSGPYSSSLHYTSTVGNWAWFPFNGTQFTLSYTQYPNRGSFDVYVDGSRIARVNAHGTLQWQKTYTSPIFPTGTHVVQLQNIGGSGKVMDVDAIQVLTTAAPGAGIYDDGYFNWRYTGKWNNYIGSGPYNSTLHYTLATENSALFTFTGTQFILSYTQYPNRGSFEVYVDGNKIDTVNANGTTQWQKTYTSPTLAAGAHLVRFKNIGGSGPVIDVDAIQVINSVALGAGKYDDSDSNWSYAGNWKNYSGTGPYNSTLHYTATVGDTVSFRFSGTQFILSYTQYSNRGSFEVYVDGNKVTTINANGTVQWQTTYTSPTFSAGTHVVQIKNIGGSGTVIDVDAIQILP